MGLVTILLCSSAPGLEVLSPDGQWTSAPKVPGSFIVNVADFLMRWTNGIYQSTVHRVVNRTSEARYSVPLFFSINYDQVVEVSLLSLFPLRTFRLLILNRRYQLAYLRIIHPNTPRFGPGNTFCRGWLLVIIRQYAVDLVSFRLIHSCLEQTYY
jgi:hypothetical protein